MAKIIADNQDIEDEIKKQIKLVYDNGGWINPDLIIRIDNGELSMEMPEGTDPKTVILNVPSFLLVPATILDVTIKDDAFVFAVPEGLDFPEIKYEMATRVFNLYNLTDKAASFRKNSFWVGLSQAPALMEKVTAARTLAPSHKKWKKILLGKPSEEAFNRLLTEMFLKTRVLGTVGRKEDRRREQRGALMPLIDILNHHRAGAGFRTELHGSRPCMAIRSSQPIKGSNECFAIYGIIDALDTFLRYDFIDREAPFVRSVPLTLDLGDLGIIEVLAVPGGGSKVDLPAKMADLRTYMPVINEKEKGRVQVSHLLIPEREQACMALRRVLAWVIGTLAGKHLLPEQMKALVLKAEDKILAENKAYYRSLLADIEATGGDLRIKQPLRDLATLQLEKLEGYQPLEIAV